MNLSTKQKQSYRCRKQTYSYQGMDKIEDWDRHIHIIIYQIYDLTRTYCIAQETLLNTLMAYMRKESKTE